MKDLVQTDKLISAINLSKMTGLGGEYLLLYELRQIKFTDSAKVKLYIESLSSSELLSLLSNEEIHSTASLEAILTKAV